MHPDGAEENEIELQSETEGLLKTREPVSNPTDARVRMAALPFCPHGA
ncbi:MAG: hypothetical protein ACLQU2_05340 [Candidatus Binataceae bacterium]